MIFWEIIPVLTEKNSKKRLLEPMPWSKINGPEIVEEIYTVAHSIPDVTPRKNKNSSIRPGYYMRGLPVHVLGDFGDIWIGIYFGKFLKNQFFD
jgi:hypothetical protein